MAPRHGPQRYTMKKKIVIAGISLAAAAACVAGVLSFIHYSGRISYSGSFAAGVRDRVMLERDSSGTPVITAKGFEDAYFGLGFLHAQDRYAMMEYFRAMAAGSSAGILGKEGRALDRLSRAVGFARRARDLAGRVREPYAGYLGEYARGVNEARRRLKLSDAVPRDWDAADILAVLALREWCNAFLNNREALFAFERGSAVGGIRDIIPEGLIHYYDESESDSVEAVRKAQELVRNHAGIFDRGYAFYLPAQKIRDNYPVTAYSFEDMLSVYPGWYPVHVHCGGRIIKGITHAGLPFIFAGNNLDLSFYGFSANIDAQDLVAETIIRTGATYQYLGAAGWRDFEIVPGGDGGAPVHATENGPVLNDIFDAPEYGSSVVTVRSVFFGPEYVASLFEVPLSRTIAEAGARVRGVVSLPRVYLFSSDMEARRAWSGMVPVGKKTDAMLLSGHDPARAVLMDLSLLPDAAGGGGARTAGSSFVSDAPLPARERALPNELRHLRLAKMLDKKKRFTNEDVMNVLMDRSSTIARMFLPEFLVTLGDNPMASTRLTRVYFQNWKYQLKSDFNGPSIFHILLQRFMYETFADELRDRTDGVLAHWDLLAPGFFTLIKENKSSAFDDSSTYKVEHRDAIFDRAFLNTMRFFNRSLGPDINDWTWGNLHRGRFTVPGADAVLDDLPLDGGSDTLFRGSLGAALKPVEATSLAGLFGIEESLVFMNYAYSTDPNSEFYYGDRDRAGTFGFHNLRGIYTMYITPGGK